MAVTKRAILIKIPANINPIVGLTNTIMDRIIDNMPTPMPNLLDHPLPSFDLVLWTIRDIPSTSNATPSNITTNILASNGNIKAMIDKIKTIIPNPMLENLDFSWLVIPEIIFSIPAKSSRNPIKNTREIPPKMGLIITIIDKSNIKTPRPI